MVEGGPTSRLRIGFMAAVAGLVVGVVATLVLRPMPPPDDVVRLDTASGAATNPAPIELPPPEDLIPPADDSGEGGRAGTGDGGEPAPPPPAHADPPPVQPDPAPDQVQPAAPEPEPGSTLPAPRATWRAELEAEPGWAPTADFSATVVLVEATDGSWHAEIVARGLQPNHRHHAGVSWDAPFLSSFCTGMSSADGAWRCQAEIDMTHVPAGSSPQWGELGGDSGRIWAHGELRQS